MSDPLLLGGIEAGGTKFLCAVTDRDGSTLRETRIATTTPAETLGAASAFFREAQRTHGNLSALSIGSFGPLSLNPLAADHGTEPQTLAQLDHDYIVRVFDQRVLSGTNLRLLYMQYLPGQSFDLKGVPDGTYLISVDANPNRTGGLFESDYDNNQSTREVVIGTKAGKRTVSYKPIPNVAEPGEYEDW